MSSRTVIASIACALVAIGAGLLFGGPSADGVVAAAVKPAAAEVLMIDCSHGKAPTSRSAFYAGQMDRIDAADRMRMRFSLSEKIGTSKHWRGIAVPALRGWRVSDPGVRRFIYRQHVDGLKAGTAYRMTVDFQWLDANGEPIASTTDQSRICRQRGKLPNLAFRDDVHARPGRTPGTYGYAARIHNNGRVPSPPTTIELRVNGAQVDVRPVGRLKPGERRMIRFVGPACVTAVEGRLDPKGTVREIAEGDNAVSAPCSRVVFD